MASQGSVAESNLRTVRHCWMSVVKPPIIFSSQDTQQVGAWRKGEVFSGSLLEIGQLPICLPSTKGGGRAEEWGDWREIEDISMGIGLNKLVCLHGASSRGVTHM